MGGGGEGAGRKGGVLGGGGDGGGERTVHDPSSRLAKESKLTEAKDMQPGMVYVQHAIHGMFASIAKLRARVSMQPISGYTHEPTCMAVARES